jgi:hypothetical protein
MKLTSIRNALTSAAIALLTISCMRAPLATPHFCPIVAPGTVLVSDRVATERVSSWDKSGGNEDFIIIRPGETAALAAIQGPAEITHLWFTFSGEEFFSRFAVLRIFWDGAAQPAVEAPIGDFFLSGQGLDLDVVSQPIIVSNGGAAKNCYFRMPFAKSARFEISNDGFENLQVYYYIDYDRLKRAPDSMLYFHAKYNQAYPTKGWIELDVPAQKRIEADRLVLEKQNTTGVGNYTILDTRGKGYYVGSTLNVHSRAIGWWGEGDDMIFIDDARSPTLLGTGTEDYFSNAWGLRRISTPLYGVPLFEFFDKGSRSSVYRFHLEDPIHFSRRIRVTIEHGHANSRSDDYASVAYWYKDSAGDDFGSVPPVAERQTSRMRAVREMMAAFRSSWRLQMDGCFDDAIRLCRTVLNRYPGNTDMSPLEFLIARFLLAEGHVEESKRAFQRIADESPGTFERSIARDFLHIYRNRNNALLVISGDDFAEVYLDGERLGEVTIFDGFKLFKLELEPGPHMLALRCRNVVLFAGVIAELITLDGSLITDTGWQVSSEKVERWQYSGTATGNWQPAVSYGTNYARVGKSRDLGVMDWIGSQAQWIWDDTNYEEERTLYFRKSFMIDVEEWRRSWQKKI